MFETHIHHEIKEMKICVKACVKEEDKAVSIKVKHKDKNMR